MNGPENDLESEMQKCTSVSDCLALAGRDAYGEYEEAAGWQACLETLFIKGTPVQVLGEEATLDGFGLVNELSVVAICRRHTATAKVAPESIKFLNMTPVQRLWLKAWKLWSHA